jgi:hypothetical protein
MSLLSQSEILEIMMDHGGPARITQTGDRVIDTSHRLGRCRFLGNRPSTIEGTPVVKLSRLIDREGIAKIQEALK